MTRVFTDSAKGPHHLTILNRCTSGDMKCDFAVVFQGFCPAISSLSSVSKRESSEGR